MGYRFLFLIFTFSGFHLYTANQSLGWGHRQEINDPYFARLSLIWRVIQTNEIRFCVEIEPNEPFDKESISAQTEMALKTWLEPLKVYGVLGTRIQEVPCDPSNRNDLYDFKISIKDEGQGGKKAHYGSEMNQQNHFFPHIIINTAYRSLAQETHIDHKSVASVPEGNFRNSLRAAKNQQLDSVGYTDQWAKYRKRNGLSPLSLRQVRLSTYFTLIHELGHAFGLCDTYDLRKCDLNYQNFEYPSSIMKCDRGYFYLTEDDTSGIRSLFKRFSHPQY